MLKNFVAKEKIERLKKLCPKTEHDDLSCKIVHFLSELSCQ